MASRMTFWRFFFHRDHLLIVIGAFVLLGVVSFLTLNISFLNLTNRSTGSEAVMFAINSD